MKVWLLMGNMSYEGSVVGGIYDSLYKAELALIEASNHHKMEIFNDDPIMGLWSGEERHFTYTIEEDEVL